MSVSTTERPVLGRGTLARVLRGVLVILTIAALAAAFVSVNFFFYFTVLSNILAAALMAGQAIRPGSMSSNGTFRGAVTLYMAITGMVYAVLLRPIEADVGLTDPWINYVLHTLGPVTLLVDWLLFPPERRLARNALWIWLVFPAIYLAVTLARGRMVDWYPYPFLDPRQGGGYGSVVAYSAGVLLVFVAVGAFLRWWADQRGSVQLATASQVGAP